MRAVEWLIKQLARADEEVPQAHTAFTLLDAAATPAQRQAWAQEMANANKGRTANVEAMDCYNPQTEPGMSSEQLCRGP